MRAVLAGAAVATGGTLGVLIPPSTVMVLYSIATETPIPSLFMAGIIPGILTIIVVSLLTAAPDRKVQELVEHVRYPNLRGDTVSTQTA